MSQGSLYLAVVLSSTGTAYGQTVLLCFSISELTMEGLIAFLQSGKAGLIAFLCVSNFSRQSGIKPVFLFHSTIPEESEKAQKNYENLPSRMPCLRLINKKIDTRRKAMKHAFTNSLSTAFN